MPRPRAPFISLCLSAVVLSLTATSSHSEETGLLVDQGQMELTVRCLSLNRVKNTKIISKQHIAFYTRDGAVYVNKLPRKCHSLSNHKSFAYRTTVGKLCDLDTITVIDNFGGSFNLGPSCGLGQFTLTSEEGLQLIKERVEMEKKLK